MPGSPLSAAKELRARWYLQVDKYGKSVTEVCDVFGISRKTYYKWYKKDHPIYRIGKPPRRMHPHTKITGHVQVKIADAKSKYNFGPAKMHDWMRNEYGIIVSASAIYKFYKKKRLIRKPQKKQQWYTPLKKPYKATKAGENVQLDVKYVPGIDCTWNYQYRFICTVTNYQYAITMERRTAQHSIKALKQAQQYFPFEIIGIQTDNGSEFRGDFHQHLVDNSIPQRYIPKKSSPWNGKVERANRSVDDEYYLNQTRPWKTILQYTKWYNTKRPHHGKGMHGMTPLKKYLSLAG